MRHAAGHRALLALSLFLAACGGKLAPDDVDVVPTAPTPAPSPPKHKTPPSGGGGTPVTKPDPGPGPVFNPSFPQAVSEGGPVITTPKVIPIVFAGDPRAEEIKSMTGKLATSTYFGTLSSEYGVGAMSVGDMIVVSETAPTDIDNTGIESWLADKLSGATPAFGTIDSNTLYAVFYPAGTTITFNDATSSGSAQSCVVFGGYHYEFEAQGTRAGYAVLPRCDESVSSLSVSTSHELFEWATDPFPLSQPAYDLLDDDHWAWGAVMLSELSDLCTYLDREDLVLPELGFPVQRHWSNKASKAGAYPCAPNRPNAYVQAIPRADDKVHVTETETGRAFDTKAIVVPTGASRKIDVLLYSDKSSSESFSIQAIGGAGMTNSQFTYTIDDVGTTGTVVQLQIDAPESTSSDLLLLASTTDVTTIWPVLVTTQTQISSDDVVATFDRDDPEKLGAIGKVAGSGRRERTRTRLPRFISPVRAGR